MRRRDARGGTVAAIAATASLAGCGATARAPAPPNVPGVPTVTLALHHDAGDHQLLACSLVHHYARFAPGRPIAFDGALRPAPAKPRVKVKVKIKRCVDGRFQDSGSWIVRDTADGRFRGALRLPGNGVFFARASYRAPAGPAQSDKFYFDVG